jgi:hypothetical protein
MSKTIEVKQDESRLSLHNKIVKAAEKFDTLSYQQAEQVAAAADVSKWRVLRVWDEEGLDLESIRSDTTLYWDDLSNREKNLLGKNYNEPEKTQHEIEEEVGASAGTLARLKCKKGFLLEDKYRPDDLDQRISNSTETSKNETNESEGQTKELESVIAALNEANIEFELEIATEKDSFEVIERLISNGHSDLAKEYFEGEDQTFTFQ